MDQKGLKREWKVFSEQKYLLCGKNILADLRGYTHPLFTASSIWRLPYKAHQYFRFVPPFPTVHFKVERIPMRVMFLLPHNQLNSGTSLLQNGSCISVVKNYILLRLLKLPYSFSLAWVPLTHRTWWSSCPAVYNLTLLSNFISFLSSFTCYILLNLCRSVLISIE